MGPCLCGDTACPSCNPGGREAEAQAERVAGIFQVHLGRIGTTRKITIVDGWGEGLHHPVPAGTPLAELLELVEVRTGPIPARIGAEPPAPDGIWTEATAAEALDAVVLELGIELEGEAYGEGYEAGISDAGQAQAEAQEAADLAAAMRHAEDLENAPADPIAEPLGHLAERARLIPRGAAFHGGPLDGASRYNVALAGLREIVAWDHQRKGPASGECTACGELRACSPQGATDYPLCLACYQVAVLEAAQGPRPPAVKPADHTFTPAADAGGDPDPGTCDLCGKGRPGHPEPEDLDLPLWAIYTEDGDLDGYVRAKDHTEALAEAAETGIDGDYTVELAGDEPAPARPPLVDAAGVTTVAGAEAMFAAQDHAQLQRLGRLGRPELGDHLAPFRFPNLPELRIAVVPEVPGGVALVTERAALEAWARDCAPPPGALGVLVFHDRDGNPVAEAEITSVSARLDTWLTWQVHAEDGELLGTVLAPDHAAALEAARAELGAFGDFTAEVTP